MNREITFNNEIAKILGVSSAVVINNLINSTRLLGRRDEDGGYYINYSLSDIAHELDFYNERTIRRAIDNILNKGCISIKEDCSGKYLRVNYDVIHDLLNDNLSI